MDINRNDTQQQDEQIDPLNMDQMDITDPELAETREEIIAERDKFLKVLKHVLVYTFLCIMALMVIIPFYWMLLVSLKSTKELEAPIQSLFTPHPQWKNYMIAMTTPGFNFGRLLFNTIFVGVISTAGTLVTTILAAFAFARLKFKGREAAYAGIAEKVLHNFAEALEEEAHTTCYLSSEELMYELKMFKPHVDVFVLDIEMPRMDGYTLAGEIRKYSKYRNLPLIAVTSRTSKSDRLRGVEAGMTEYITKPYSPEYLENVVRKNIKLV